MKVCVVGYGAMGKILANLLGDELACVVALECENKRLEDTNGNFDVIIDCSSPVCLDMVYNYAIKHNKPVVFATTGYTEEQLMKIKESLSAISSKLMIIADGSSLKDTKKYRDIVLLKK